MVEGGRSQETPTSARNSASPWHAEARVSYLARHGIPQEIPDNPAPTLQESLHKHHWKIDEPTGPTSHGACAGCGAQKVFKNWLEESDFITSTEHRFGV